jgi:4-hydroxy-3-polyprenylbenzoate decarboxylase
MALIGPGPGTRDLRDFLKLLEERGQLRRITAPVDPDLELAAIADRVLAAGGPALLFENVIGSSMPVAVNTLGTVERVVWSMGLERAEQLEELGSRLAILQQPRPPKDLKETKQFARVFWDLVKARPDRDLVPPCRQQVFLGDDVNLDQIPLIRPWPGDAGGVITLGLVITKDPETGRPKCGGVSVAASVGQHDDGALVERSWWGPSSAQGSGAG